MLRAIIQPLFLNDYPRSGQKRPIVEAAELIIRARDIGFRRSLSRERMDSGTGQIVSRPADARDEKAG